MKKIMMILACVLVCFSLFTGCTNQKGNDDQDTNLGNSVEIDDTDIEIDTEPGLDTEDNSDDVTLPDGFTYSFRDPDNADGIETFARFLVPEIRKYCDSEQGQREFTEWQDTQGKTE